MGATIAQGRAVVQGQDSQGAYQLVVTEPVPLTFADGDSQYPRIDLVILRVYDPQYQSGQPAKAAVEIVPGIAAADPAEPALPEVSLPLYAVRVDAGDSAGAGGIDWTSAVSDRRRSIGMYSGITPAAFLPEPELNGSYQGQYRDDGTGLTRWNGERWDAITTDSGWRDLPLDPGFVSPGHGHPAQYRMIGPVVYLRGRIGKTDGKKITDTDSILTLPVGIRPAALVGWASPRDSTTTPAVVRVELKSDGTMRVYTRDEEPSWISLDTVNYFTT